MSDLFWDYCDTVFPFLVLLLLLPRFRQVQGGLLMVLYLAVTVGLMGYSNYLADRTTNNMYLYHLYSLLEAVFLLLLLNKFSGMDRRVLWLTLSFYILFWIANVTLWESLLNFNSNTAAVLNLLTAFFCFRYFLLLIKTNEILYFQKLPSFWIVSGLLFYCIVSILVVSSYKYKDWFSEWDLHLNWRIQQVANIVKYLLISIGILCSSSRQISPVGSSSLDHRPSY